MNVVAQGGPLNLAGAGNDQHDLGFRVVPGRGPLKSGLVAMANRGQQLCLGEQEGVRPQANLPRIVTRALSRSGASSTEALVGLRVLTRAAALQPRNGP